MLKQTHTCCEPQSNNKGFTLIEILIAIAIFGLVTTSMYSVYQGMQRTTYNQLEVVDVQQSLRVAVDLLTRDIEMAGLLLPNGTTSVALGSDDSVLELVTASPFYRFATIADDKEVAGDAFTTTPNGVAFNIATPEMTDVFSVGDRVRIIRPMNGGQPFNPDPDFIIHAINRASSPPTISVKATVNSSSVINYKAGDVLSLVADGAPDPCTIRWSLTGTNLERQADGGTPQIVATGIVALDGLQFAYLKDDGSEPDPTALDSDDLEELVAVRLTLRAQTDNQLDNVDRQRSLITVARLRN